MRTYLFRRLLGAIPLLLGIATISFLFMMAMPGGPDTMLARNSRMSAEQLANIRRNMGLDQPVVVQFGRWMLNLARGDLGLSFTRFQPVSDVIKERVGPTVRLVSVAIVISVILAIGLGVISAVWRYSWFDYLTTTLSYIGLALPVFWLALMLQVVFALQLRLLPSADMNSERFSPLLHLILPATTLAIGTVASWSRYVRSSMLEVVNLDYIRTARAKGVRALQVITKHALRNALIPFITVVALDVPFYLAGAVLTETIFSWPGLGRLFFESLRSRDYPVLMGLLAYSAVLIVLFNIIADLIYAWLDPRIKYQ